MEFTVTVIIGILSIIICFQVSKKTDDWNRWWEYFAEVLICMIINGWMISLVIVGLELAGIGMNSDHIYAIWLLLSTIILPTIMPLFINYFWGQANLSKAKSIRKGRALAMAGSLNGDISRWRISSNPSAIEIEMCGYVYGYLTAIASYTSGFSGYSGNFRKYYIGPSWLIEECEKLNSLRSSHMIGSEGLEAIKSFELGLEAAKLEVMGYLYEGLEMPTGLQEYIKLAPKL